MRPTPPATPDDEPRLVSTQKLVVQEEAGVYSTVEVPAAEIFVGRGAGGRLVISDSDPGGPVVALRSSSEGIEVVRASGGATVNGEPVTRPRPLGKYDLLEFAGALLRSSDGLSESGGVVAAPRLPQQQGSPASAEELPAPGSGALFASRYRLERELGRGGFGAVYSAWDTQLQRRVAIKVLMRADARALQRFANEIRATAVLRHEGLITVHDSGIEGAHPYLVMEYVEGQTLDRLAGPGLSTTRAALIMRDVARALAHAHEQGLLHRDLKPHNVIVQRDGRAKLLDFGLVRILWGDEELNRITRSGTRLGTLPYMSPEQAFAGEHDIRSEVYGLGATLYHALTGRPPFAEEEELLMAIVGAQPPPPSTLRPDVPPDLEAICARCLEKRPRQRYASAAALAEDLERFLEGLPTEARPLGRVESMRRRLAREQPTQLAAGAVLLLALAVGLLLAQVLGGSHPAPGGDGEGVAPVPTADRPAGGATEPAAREREERRQALRRRLDALVSAPGQAPEQAAVDLVRFGQDPAVAELGAWLTALAEELLAVERQALLEANQGLGAGEQPLAGLAAAADARASRPLGSPAPAAERELIAQAESRLRGRARGPDGTLPTYLDLVARRQERALGAARLEAAGVVARALVALEPGPAGLAALGRYLQAEASALRALPAGVALARLRDPAVVPTLLGAYRRYGAASVFARRVGPLLKGRVTQMALPSETAAAYLERGRFLMVTEDPDAALRDLARAIELDPTLDEAYMLRAAVLQALGDYPGARTDLDRAIALSPEASEPWSNRANLRLLQGNAAGARQDAQQAVHLNPGNALAHFNLGQALGALGDRQGALRSYTEALQADPSYAAAWVKRAATRAAQGDLSGAEADATRALAIDPGDGEAHGVRGLVHARRREWGEALEALGRAIDLSPGVADYRFERARVHEALGELSVALEDYGQAIRLASSEQVPDVLVARAMLQQRLNDPAAAAADLDWALNLDADHGGALRARCAVRLSRGDVTGAQEDIERLLRASPQKPEVWALAASLRLATGDEEGGQQALARALELDPNTPQAFLVRGLYLTGQGRLREALGDLDRFVALAPHVADGYFRRGLLRLRLGDREGAAVDLTRFLEMDPSGANAAAARAQLAELRGGGGG